MKILHLIVGLGNGGAENTLLKVCKSKNNNFTHEVISLTKNVRLISDFKKNNIKVHIFDFKKYGLNIIQYYKIIKIIKSSNISLICSWMYHACFITIFLNLFLEKKKFLWLIRHGNFKKQYTKKTTIYLKNFLKLFSKMPKAILYCSEFSRRIHKKNGFNNSCSYLIPNGVDIDKFNFNLKYRNKFRRKFKIPLNYFVIGMVGRNNPQKNHHQLFRILKKETFKNINLAIVLIGNDVKKLKSSIKQNNKNHKYFFLNEKKNICDYYSMFDLHLSLSNFGESFPNVIIESMSCQIPTIASNISDNKKIIYNKSMIYKLNNDIELTKRIVNIIKKTNKKNIKSLKKKMRNHVINNFSLSKMIKNYDNIFNKYMKKIN